MYMYTVTELANRCDTAPHAVRYYTRMSLLRPKTRMEHTLDQWSEMPDSVPDGHSVCHLIESVVGEAELEQVASENLRH